MCASRGFPPFAMVHRFDDFELDVSRHQLRKGGRVIPVEPQVFSLLLLLVENGGRVVTKDEIHEKVWEGRIVSEAAVNSRIRSAREAIDDDGAQQRKILTVRGTGFRFIAEVVSSDGTAPATPPPSVADSAPAIARPAVAVMPFANVSGDTAQDFLADAIASDLITNLSKHRWLSVAARNSTFCYKGRDADARVIGRELGVQYVVDGTVRRHDRRLRVTVQLVDAATGLGRWVDQYDRDIDDVFAVVDEITAIIAARLEPEIGFAERSKVARLPRRDLHAWECYHLGVAAFFKFTEEANHEAQRLLQRSRELDPDFGEAHAWWAYAVILGMVYWQTEPDQARFDEAHAATERALEIDPQNAVFHALKARVQLARCEYGSAMSANETAIALNPTFAGAYCGLADSLCYEGRYEEAIVHFRRAIELSPNDPQRWAFLTYGAMAFLFHRDFESSIEWADRALQIPNCQYWTLAHKAVALAALGRTADAKETVRRLVAAKPEFTRAFARKRLFYLRRADQLEFYVDGLAKAGVPR